MPELITYTLQFFTYEHLPEHLQQVSRPFCQLAQRVAAGPMNLETFCCLRRLLEAKDAAVRAAVSQPVDTTD